MRRDQACRAIIEHTIDLITFIDLNGEILLESPSVERLLGYLPAERSGRSIFDPIHPDDLPKARAAFQAALTAKNRTPFIELRVRRKDGQWRTFESVGSYIEDGGVGMGLVHSRDITDRKLLEAGSRHGQKLEALGRLAGSVAHDFNNVLTAILGYTEQLLETEAALPIGMELREIRKAAELAAGLTRQLLAFSRRTPPDVERLDVNVVLHELRGLLQRLLGKATTFTMTTGARAAHILAAKGAVEQVVINLALNARDAMAARGAVIAIRTWNSTLPARVGSAADGSVQQYVVIDVSDTGVGMSAEVAARLFEPFFTTKEPGKGTGLGLSTAFNIVQEANGWIDVETAEGRGTTVHVYLPVV